MKITIMGTGGLGGYIGGRLAQAGNDVTFIARGKQLDALAASGLRVKCSKGDFHLPVVHVTRTTERLQPPDLIVLGVKAYDLLPAIDAIAPIVGHGTAIVPILNGVEHLRILSDHFGEKHVLGGLSNMTAHVVAPGIVERIGEHGGLEFGEQAGGISERVKAIEAVLDIDGLNGKASKNISIGMWQKFATICAANTVCAVRGDKQVVLRGMPETGDLMRQLGLEVIRVAQAMHIGLQDAFVDSIIQLFETVPLHFKTSTLLGLERGERLELDALHGAVVRMGRKLGVPTPANEFVFTSLKPHMAGAWHSGAPSQA